MKRPAFWNESALSDGKRININICTFLLYTSAMGKMRYSYCENVMCTFLSPSSVVLPILLISKGGTDMPRPA